MREKITIVFAILVCFCSAVSAQSLVGTAAVSYHTNDVSMDWSVGEPVIETDNANGSSLTQGVLQPESLIVSSINTIDQSVGISCYPNPTTTSITLVHNNYSLVKYQLFDGVGNLLKASQPERGDIQVDLSNYAAGIYYMHVYNEKGEQINTFKIDKVK